jgi:diguanylate cyclase (GGDEF)-like protein
MMLGVLLVPVAVAHPGHQKPVVVRAGDERDQLGALAAHLAVWALTYLGLRDRLVSTVLVVLAIVCVATIFARVFLVRRSELHLVSRLRRMAFTDPLTGIGNRRSLAAALGSLGHGWLITLDLDGFKQVNDEHGHDAGDTVLCAVARKLGELTPPTAHLARIGGDEFAVALPGSADQAIACADRLVASARDPRYPTVTLSVGVAEIGADPATSLRDSDIALREAKRTGKNRVARLTPALLGRQLREVEVAARLRSGMADVHLAYQPIVALNRHHGFPAPVAVEALARWHDDLLGDVSPAEFIPICERHGLIGDLGLHVLSEGLRQLGAWHAAGLAHQLTVNVSWQQLRDPQIVAQMAALLARHPKLTGWLVLEVTESVFADDPQASAAVARLREQGVGIAVDDFGAGASTLTRLRNLPADILKIDRSLLDGVGVDPAADSILTLVHGLGDAMGMVVVAEGIEDADTARLIGELGFRYAQGHYFGVPGPAASLPAPLGRRLSRRADRHRYAGA